MKQIKLNVSPREVSGRRPSRRMRRDGQIPAVVYGKQGEPRSLQVKATDFEQMLRSTKGGAALIELQENGKKTLSIVQEVQEHPVTDSVLHVDFHEVSAAEMMETHIAVHINGEAFGVKSEKGVLEVLCHELTIRCLPKDLPEFIEVDITDLRLGQAIHIKELPAIEGVTIMADPEQVVVSCSEPRVIVEPSDEVAGEEEEAEKKGEEEEGEKKESSEKDSDS